MLKKILLFTLILFCNSNIIKTDIFNFNIADLVENTENLSVIKLHNETDGKIYAAQYYEKDFYKFKCKISSPIYEIESNKKFLINKDRYKLSYNNKLLITNDKTLLKKSLTQNEYNSIKKVDINLIEESEFYVISRNNHLDIYNKYEWQILKPFLNLIQSIDNPIVEEVIYDITAESYNNKIARTTEGLNQTHEESEFIKKRHNRIAQALREKFDINPSKIPNVAFSFSGGGYRAMISSLGTMQAAKKSKLLDLVSYISSLSGSSWFFTPWLNSELSLNDYEKILKPKVAKSIFATKLDVERLVKKLIVRKIFKQDITASDIIAELMRAIFFDDLPNYNHKISSLKDSVDDAVLPLPIINMAQYYNNDFYCYELNPFTGKSHLSETTIPAEAFNRKFIRGFTVQCEPEEDLGYINAITGSSATDKIYGIAEYVVSKIEGYPEYKEIIQKLLNEDIPSTPKMDNELYNQAYKFDCKEYNCLETLRFLDEGSYLNISVPSLLSPEHNLDLIVIFDYSRTPKYVDRLKRLKAHADAHGYPMPDINIEKIDQPGAYIFDGSKNNAPTLIFIPLMKDPDYSESFDPNHDPIYDTYNFTYTNEQFDTILNAAKFNFNKYKDVILKEIKKLVN